MTGGKLLHWNFLLREMYHGRQHGMLFVLCVALSLTTMVALDAFKSGVSRSLFQDARKLHGGDVLVHSHYPFSQELQQEIASLVGQGVETTRVHEFFSMVRGAGERPPLLVEIRSVDERFPLYGKVELVSGKQLAEVLSSGNCVVAPEVLQRLGLERGDMLKVGSTSLRIIGVVAHEAESSISIFQFGPRVFVSEADLEAIDLVQKGTRVDYEVRLRLNSGMDLETVTARLKNKASPAQERVRTYRGAESGVKRFFDNLLFFLSLISIFTLLLAGLGMQSSLTALMRGKEKTIAVARSVGATGAFLFRHYLVLVIIFGLIGGGIGVVLGLILAEQLPALFQGLLPLKGSVSVHPADVGEGLALGLMVVLIFAFLPLRRLHRIKPVVTLRRQAAAHQSDKTFYLVIFAGAALITFLVIRQLEDPQIGVLFMVGIAALLVITSLLTNLFIKAGGRLSIRSLSLRQAFRSMTRAGNATRPTIVTLASALSLLFAIYLVEYNLYVSYMASYPKDAPNVFALDIQPDQRQGIEELLPEDAELHPVVRARLLSINGERINRQRERERRGDNLTREFNLTYREHLLEDEVLQEGEALFPKKQGGSTVLQVSVLETVAKRGEIELHDRLRFNIQGVELEAEVTSIRNRTKSKLYPFFYFVFPPQFLQSAPQTFFAALRLPRENIADLQARVVDQYPNISFINVTKAVEDIEVLVIKLSKIVTFFAFFSIFAGALILISSILATRLERLREAVYYTILGSKRRFIYSVCLYENGIIGFFSGVIGLLLAQCSSWLLCRFVFELEYSPSPFISLLLVVVTTMFIVLLGWMSSLSIITHKPVRFLREHAGGE